MNGSWQRTVWLRPLSGWDEAFLIEDARLLLPAERTTALLQRVLEDRGTGEPVTSEFVRELSIGDREALLLHLRRLTLGEKISCVLSCPQPTCGEQMDLDLKVSDLLLPPGTLPPQEEYETVVEGEGKSYRVRFRMPNGGDQEAAAALATRDYDAAVSLLYRRCVKSSVLLAGEDDTQLELTLEAKRALQQVMSGLDEQAEVLLNLTCPACKLSFVLPFDTGDYFYRELTRRGDNIYREVHLLALHYHWSEAEIMNMSRQRRRLYLGMLADSLNSGRRP